MNKSKHLVQLQEHKQIIVVSRVKLLIEVEVPNLIPADSILIQVYEVDP